MLATLAPAPTILSPAYRSLHTRVQRAVAPACIAFPPSGTKCRMSLAWSTWRPRPFLWPLLKLQNVLVLNFTRCSPWLLAQYRVVFCSVTVLTTPSWTQVGMLTSELRWCGRMLCTLKIFPLFSSVFICFHRWKQWSVASFGCHDRDHNDLAYSCLRQF